MSRLNKREDGWKALNNLYNSAVKGVCGSKSCTELASEYLNKYKDPDTACKRLIENQIAKCTASGFLTAMGGVMTLPAAMPANVTYVLYMQLRLITAIASMAGYDPNEDEVRTMTFLCLLNTSASDLVKSTGIRMGNRITMRVLRTLPGSILSTINYNLGFHFMSGFTGLGLFSFMRNIPVAGGLVGGAFDYMGTRIVGIKARQAFFESDYE